MLRNPAAAIVLALLASAPASALKTESFGVVTAAGAARRFAVASGRASVKFSVETSTAQIDAELSSIGAFRARTFRGGWYGAAWTDGAPVAVKLAALKSLPGVTIAEPSKSYRAFLSPNDPLFNSQYALAAVNAPAGWEYEVGNSSRVTVAVIDAGIDGTQPDLVGKMGNVSHQYCDPGADLTTGADDLPCVTAAATPACDHATHVAGVAAASTDNGLDVAGMSWGAQLLSLKVFEDAACPSTDCSDATCGTDDWAISNAIYFAVNHQNLPSYGHIVINMSLGETGACSSVLSNGLGTAIPDALAAGIVVVAAAGNDSGDVNAPGNCPGVIPMGATDNTNQIASFSSRGPELASGGLVAPGVQVLTTDLNGGTVGATGTSFASPMGAGLAALLLSAKPNLTPAQVQSIMRAGAQDLGQPSTTQGAGLMNVYRSLRFGINGTLAGFDGDVKPIAFPNPFRLSQTPNVTFSFPASLQGGDLDIKIYTLQGGFVRELTEPLWDGKNANGNLVASGTYVYVVKTDKGTSTARLAVIR